MVAMVIKMLTSVKLVYRQMLQMLVFSKGQIYSTAQAHRACGRPKPQHRGHAL